MRNWQTLTPERARKLRAELPETAALGDTAARIAAYPGGGAPAHKLREAARLIREVRDEWLIGDAS